MENSVIHAVDVVVFTGERCSPLQIFSCYLLREARDAEDAVPYKGTGISAVK